MCFDPIRSLIQIMVLSIVMLRGGKALWKFIIRAVLGRIKVRNP